MLTLKVVLRLISRFSQLFLDRYYIFHLLEKWPNTDGSG